MLMRESLSCDQSECQGGEKQNQQGSGDVNDNVLDFGPALGLSVGNTRERDHRVKWQIKPGQRRLEEVVEIFLCPKCFRGRLIAHLDEIAEREIGQGVGVHFSPLKIFRERLLPVRELMEGFVEDNAIFERSVHSLSIE